MSTPLLEAVVATPRLRLEVITPEEAAGMLAGRRKPSWHPAYPRKDDLDGISMISADLDDLSWNPRHIVRAFDGLVVGSIGFFGPPDTAGDGVLEAEIGYGLVEDARGRGVASEAVSGLLAHTDRIGVRVRASVEPGNTPSVRVLAKCGFTELRGADEDGNLVMARPLPV
ncbi:[ribosomal protein S5]-alanine N-acetyltransferase [Marmoricola sp. URHA0025 HA25]